MALYFVYNLTSNKATLAQVTGNADLMNKIGKLSHNPLSTFKTLADSVIKRLGVFGKAERLADDCETESLGGQFSGQGRDVEQ